MAGVIKIHGCLFSFFLILLAAGCNINGGRQREPAWKSPVAFDTAQVRITSASDTVLLQVEIAATAQQRKFGLMGRPALGPDTGMLFVYPSVQDSTAGFWMFRTRMPLDIAFIDSAGNIVSILAMEPCESPNPEGCPTYQPGVRYSSALEVNRGYLASHGIGLGARVVLEPGDSSRR